MYICERCGFELGYEICRKYCFPLDGGVVPGNPSFPPIHWCEGVITCPDCGFEIYNSCSD